MRRIVGVIPAAGHATRLQPLEGSKELCDVAGRPVMDYLIDRLRAGGAEEIRVVTRRDKRDLVGHALELGLEVIEAEPATVTQSVGQGLGGLAAEDVVLIGLPDTVWEPLDAFATLVRELGDVALGVFPSPEPERSDVVELDGSFVTAIQVKPAIPPGRLIWGIAAARRSALDELERFVELGQLFDHLAQNRVVRAVEFPGELLDIGTAASLERARDVLTK